MAGEECEALSVLLKEHLAEIAMAKTYFTAVSNRSGDAEALQALADCGSGLVRPAAVLLDGDCRADGVCPLCVLEADGLNILDKVIDIQTGCLGDGLAFLDGGNAILVQSGQNLGLSSFI